MASPQIFKAQAGSVPPFHYPPPPPPADFPSTFSTEIHILSRLGELRTIFREHLRLRGDSTAIIIHTADSENVSNSAEEDLNNWYLKKRQQLTEGKRNTKILNDNQSFPLWTFVPAEVLLTELEIPAVISN